MEGRCGERYVLGVDHGLQFVPLDLSIAAHITVFDQPSPHLGFGPSVPNRVGGRVVVVLDELEHLFAFDLSLGLDNVVLDEPVVEIAIGPGRPDVVLYQELETHIRTIKEKGDRMELNLPWSCNSTGSWIQRASRGWSEAQKQDHVQ
jgi:hypothetical protein